jgi:hypothetical protein
MAKVEVPARQAFPDWQRNFIVGLKGASFFDFPKEIPAAKLVPGESHAVSRVVTERGITNHVRVLRDKDGAKRVVIWLSSDDVKAAEPQWLKGQITSDDAVYAWETRGFGDSRWTRKNPPNYVERSHYLLGRTVDTGRVWDVIAAARYLAAENDGAKVFVAAETNLAVIAAFAAALDKQIAGVILRNPSASLMVPNAPAILNALRIGDVQDVLGCIAPRPMTIIGSDHEPFAKVAQLYESAGQGQRVSFSNGER